MNMEMNTGATPLPEWAKNEEIIKELSERGISVSEAVDMAKETTPRQWKEALAIQKALEQNNVSMEDEDKVFALLKDIRTASKKNRAERKAPEHKAAELAA